MFKRAYFIGAYYVSWLAFGAVGLVFNVLCACLLLLPRRRAREAAVARMINRLFTFWVAWLDAAGLVRVDWRGPPIEALPRPAVYVANHPSLIDATILLALLPDAVCVFKPALLRNPFLGPAAILAGYASGDAGLDLNRGLGEKVADGRPLLLFPEGTRTRSGAVLNSLKSGFALIAQRARVPVQLLIIDGSREFLPKHRPWWTVPHFPARIEIHVDRLIPHDPDRPIGDTVAAVEQRFIERLSQAS